MKFNLKLLSIIFYGISLVIPTFIGSDNVGAIFLALGWISLFVFIPEEGLPWLANILYFISLLLFKSKVEIKLVFNALALVCGLFALSIDEIMEVKTFTNVQPGYGMLLWLLSITFLLIYNFQLYLKRKKEKRGITSAIGNGG